MSIAETNWYSEESATLGDRIAGAREMAGTSQEDLSKRLGVKLKTIRAWEQDLSEPRANKIQMLAGMLNVSIMWLMNGEGDGVEAPVDEVYLTADVNDLLTEMRQMKTQISQTAERLGHLEKRLRTALKEPSE
ncbi:multiprotein-bridging factor 1 family protein [Pseudohalocynthiibacter aestuariivivens]|jgi:transcriptional regulator with XRE-family HTH domain|uniref:Multiprotein-bridging factor 1 family protein n=1 Tax=Pseudohalocynthiibacter aestuariivivens TaxID=1591409 RepID=A0ABV5JAG9_9RHOB|nr:MULTISPECIES: helix-turn-helix domain-containing protein [Pseudohalocynthiibacter]MBS9715989.1 helix-turn-helix domain-containing protein [Pseudohalocynthiibacter aestuariivivens]MCK0102454.1 helix-turn-helix domain-containing protein [Pseudohalocynthiibacter sp. F2068]